MDPQNQDLLAKVTKELGMVSFNRNPSPPEATPAPSTTPAPELTDTVRPIPDEDIKFQKPADELLDPKAKLALFYETVFPRPHYRPRTSTFVPSSLNYYSVIHYLDALIASNEYYSRTGHAWHPFLSRIYFGMLFYYQLLRAMDVAGEIGSRQSAVYELLKRECPPEALPVPGPLLPILKSIACCETTDPIYGKVCPALPQVCGPATANLLIPASNNYLLCPNIPVLHGFARSIYTAEDNPPDYTDPTTFDHTVAHLLNGSNFRANNWTANQRSVLLQPGLYYAPETNEEIDLNFRRKATDLSFPNIIGPTAIAQYEQYTCLNNHRLLNCVIPMFGDYCQFFKDSGTLGDCSPAGPQTGLLRHRPHNLTSENAGANIIHTMTSAFPNYFLVHLKYDIRSYEPSLPPSTKLLAQYAAINTSITYRDLGNYTNLNTNGQHGRDGPYWEQSPSRMRCEIDHNFGSVEECISKHYYIPEPEKFNV